MKKVVVGFVLLVLSMVLFCISVTSVFGQEDKPMDPVYVEPGVLTAYYGDKLSDVLLPTGWLWENPNQFVGVVSEDGNQFTAVYTPLNNEYQVVTKELIVYVKKAIIRRSMVSITDGGKIGQYIPEGIILTDFPSDGYRFLFSLDEEGEYNESIKLTKTGKYTIYYKIIGENVETFSGSITVDVNSNSWVSWIVIFANLCVIIIATLNIIFAHKNKKVIKSE